MAGAGNWEQSKLDECSVETPSELGSLYFQGFCFKLSFSLFVCLILPVSGPTSCQLTLTGRAKALWCWRRLNTTPQPIKNSLKSALDFLKDLIVNQSKYARYSSVTVMIMSNQTLVDNYFFFRVLSLHFGWQKLFDLIVTQWSSYIIIPQPQSHPKFNLLCPPLRMDPHLPYVSPSSSSPAGHQSCTWSQDVNITKAGADNLSCN